MGFVTSEDLIEVVVTVAHAVIRQIEGVDWLIFRDTAGNIFQLKDCFRVTSNGGMLDNEALLAALLRAGDRVRVKYKTKQHGVLNLDTALCVVAIAYTPD